MWQVKNGALRKIGAELVRTNSRIAQHDSFHLSENHIEF